MAQLADHLVAGLAGAGTGPANLALRRASGALDRIAADVSPALTALAATTATAAEVATASATAADLSPRARLPADASVPAVGHVTGHPTLPAPVGAASALGLATSAAALTATGPATARTATAGG